MTSCDGRMLTNRGSYLHCSAFVNVCSCNITTLRGFCQGFCERLQNNRRLDADSRIAPGGAIHQSAPAPTLPTSSATLRPAKANRWPQAQKGDFQSVHRSRRRVHRHRRLETQPPAAKRKPCPPKAGRAVRCAMWQLRQFRRINDAPVGRLGL